MNDERAGVANVGQMREQFQPRYQVDASVITTLEAEGEYGARALRRVLAREVVVFVAAQASVVDACSGRMRRKTFGDRLGVFAVLLHSQRQRFDAGQDQERVERRDRRAEIAQAEHAAGDREGEVAERLLDLDAVV